MSLLNIFRKDTDAPSNNDSDHTEEIHNIEAPESPSEKPSSESPINTEVVKEEIVKALKTVYDPEIPVDIYELGLIYEIKVEEDGNTYVQMTLTAPIVPLRVFCPDRSNLQPDLSKAFTMSNSTSYSILPGRQNACQKRPNSNWACFDCASH